MNVLSGASRLLTIARLGAQLGPFESTTFRRRGPLARKFDQTTVDVDGRFTMELLKPRGRLAGALLIAPGLHYAGPLEPRMAAFFAGLARSGYLVAAPALPGFCRLSLGLDLIEDFQATYRAFLPLVQRSGLRSKMGVFSISFGSLPALRLASDPRYARDIGGLATFGGFSDWRATLRFSLTGGHPPGADGERDETVPHDPLNKPVIFMNLLDALPTSLVAADDRHKLRDAWFSYVRGTWGREDMKPESAHRPLATRLGAHLPPDLRAVFEMGCGLRPGGLDVALTALDRKDAEFLDPRPHMGGLASPLHVIHGMSDDVIPFTQAQELVDAAPAAAGPQLYLTGLYGHSRGATPASVSAAFNEAASMLKMLGAITSITSVPVR